MIACHVSRCAGRSGGRGGSAAAGSSRREDRRGKENRVRPQTAAPTDKAAEPAQNGRAKLRPATAGAPTADALPASPPAAQPADASASPQPANTTEAKPVRPAPAVNAWRAGVNPLIREAREATLREAGRTAVTAAVAPMDVAAAPASASTRAPARAPQRPRRPERVRGPGLAGSPRRSRCFAGPARAARAASGLSAGHHCKPAQRPSGVCARAPAAAQCGACGVRASRCAGSRASDPAGARVHRAAAVPGAGIHCCHYVGAGE